MKPPFDDPLRRPESESNLPVEQQAKLRLKALEKLKQMRQQEESHGDQKENDAEKGEG